MSNLTASDLIDSLKKKIQKYSEAQVEASFIGKVVKIADGVVSISGLKDIAYNEMVEFENGVQGLAINLEENTIGAIVLGEYLEMNRKAFELLDGNGDCVLSEEDDYNKDGVIDQRDYDHFKKLGKKNGGCNPIS